MKIDPAARPGGGRSHRLRGDGRLRRGGEHRQRRPRRDSVAVIGCGGVGNAAIAGACLNGAMKVIAVDIDDRSWIRPRSSAMHTVNSGAPTWRRRSGS
ncbi:hypothetical protein LT493_30595 [Streptomyces tricolor]|nr:hypothetical protein [Streptomyces tricolor]